VNFREIQDMIELYEVSYLLTRASHNIPYFALLTLGTSAQNVGVRLSRG